VGSSGSATIPATPLLPVGYDLSLTVKNLTITPVSVDVALYGTTTGGWIGWMRDPFAAGDLFAGKDQRLDKLQGLMGAGGGPAMSEDGAVLVRTIAKSDTGDEQVLHQREDPSQRLRTAGGHPSRATPVHRPVDQPG